MDSPGPTTLTRWRGRHLELRDRGGWEFVTRPNATGIVAVAALTDREELVLVEQYRPPVDRCVLELPAGLAGDSPGREAESLAEAARRELLEETGFEAGEWEWVTCGVSSAGLTDEAIDLFVARNLTRVGPGGGDHQEAITVHLVPLRQADAWIQERLAEGLMVDFRVFAALFFLLHSSGG